MTNRSLGCVITVEGFAQWHCVSEGKGEERGDVRVIGKIDSEGGRM